MITVTAANMNSLFSPLSFYKESAAGAVALSLNPSTSLNDIVNGSIMTPPTIHNHPG
jgi:hypothetical protein